MTDQSEPCGAALSSRCFNGEDGCATHPRRRRADERLVQRGEIPPHMYAHIRMQMGVASYRGVWPVGVRQ